ncbi:NAD(P)H dehydrogenase B2 isoform 2 [Theobroma cacao]|uniref:NADH:ubiquinone reductase (non-electrogenic) n=1 Tax=Theobroma cacao TaxID=3641 RepID=A0A061GMS5_THECC|nr:NAD(P)H dehydrogenase B2 isoform 2 [Theobroma cacao]
MRTFDFLGRLSRAFQDYPSLSRIIVVSTISGGGLIAYAEANTYNGSRGHIAHADAITSNGAHGIASSEAVPKKKKVVLLGTGWAGMSFLKDLNNPSYEVEVVSPRNFFVFTPLLPSVTCGKVEARSIVEPIRNIIRKKNVDISFSEAECVKIDPQNKKIYCRATVNSKLKGEEEFAVDYDYLIIAVGAQVNTFNTPGVEQNCHFLKEVEDAQKIRKNVIESFEKASLPNLSDEERKKILHFVIVGGGPTGVEFAAELYDFVNEDVVKLYPKVREFVKITLLEATDHILNMFDKRITNFAEGKFGRDGIDVKLGSMVTKIDDNEISTKARGNGNTTNTPYGMVLWSTGIGPRPLIKEFMKQIGQGNRRALATDEWLRVEGFDTIYALGDCATINQRKVMEDISEIFKKADKDESGTLTVKEFQEIIDDICERYPQVELYLKSKQVRNIVDRYRHLGQFAPLGGEQTAAQLPGDWVSIGHSSQWLWYSVYASKQVSWRTRALVVSDWVRRFIFGRDTSGI